MSRLRAFGRFWWDFAVGDDPRVAAGLLAAIALTWVLEHYGVPAWWLLPAAVGLLLAESVRREVRPPRRAPKLEAEPSPTERSSTRR